MSARWCADCETHHATERETAGCARRAAWRFEITDAGRAALLADAVAKIDCPECHRPLMNGCRCGWPVVSA